MSQDGPCCYFHPREELVGVCALCLKERLMVLASKQGHPPKPNTAHHRSFSRVTSKSKLISIAIPKVFALGSFLHWPELLHRKAPDAPHPDCISSLEDSFISIKFGDDGHASWDKKAAAEPFYQVTYTNRKTDAGLSKVGSQSVVEHTKPRGTLRWRKRIGHLLQVIRWRRSSKQGSSQAAGLVAGKPEAAKRRGWIRSLTRRRSTR